jgi:hypothetical protein
MEKIVLSNKEKLVIIFRDSTWIFFLYLILRAAITSLLEKDIDLNISITLFEKIIGSIVWLGIIYLSYYTSKVHKGLKSKFGKLLFLYFPKEISLVSVVLIILVELYILVK